MSCPQNKNNTAASFEKIYEDELNVLKKGKDDPLIGLALSGGGIRSATFNLGVIQGLAKNKVFDKFDYLSTVSGGGYIGSWLSAWIYHKSQQEDVQDFIKSDKTSSIQDDLIDSIDANSPQSDLIKFLRNYSNYLTPHASLFSMDTLSAIANYTRNLILNQSMLILTLALVLMIPRFIQKSGDLLLQNDYFWCIFSIDALLLFVAVMIIAFNLTGLTSESKTIPPSKKTASTIFISFIKSRLSSLGVFIFIVLPVIVSGWLTALIMANLAKELTEEKRLIIFLGTGGIYLLFWALGYLFSYIKTILRTVLL